MFYTCGARIMKDDVVAQLWTKPSSNYYLGTVSKIREEASIINITDNFPTYRDGPVSNITNVKFLRRDCDVRIGDSICIRRGQRAAPEGSIVVVDEVISNNGGVKYQYERRGGWISSLGHFTIVRAVGHGIATPATPAIDRCVCNGSSTETGFNTLVLTVCTVCHKEK